MIEAVMFFVLGLLTAALIALALTSALARRADRLARARVESTLPMSLGEVQAEKDQLRASYAMSARRLEMKVEELKALSNREAIAASRYKAEIAELAGARAEAGTTIGALEAQVAAAGEAVKAAEARAETARAETAARDAALDERKQAIAALEAELLKVQLLTQEQRVELVARDTAIGNLEDQLAAARIAEAASATVRADLAAALEAARGAFAGERKRSEGLEAQIAALGIERADRRAALERRSAEVEALEAALAASRTERDSLARTIAALESDQARGLDEIARRREEAARLKRDAIAEEAASAEAIGDNMGKALAAVEAEKASLEARLAALEAKHAATLAENAELRRDAPDDGEAESDAGIRATLAEIAAQVLQLTQNEAAAAPVQAENGSGSTPGHLVPLPPPKADAPPEPPKLGPAARTLAERIRSYQHAARR